MLNLDSEMNPSLFIDEKGIVQILVRCVNYKKLPEKQFTLYQSKSNSIYYNITGNIRDSDKLDIETFDYKILEYEYNLPTFPSYWSGLEDIRFIDANNVLYALIVFSLFLASSRILTIVSSLRNVVSFDPPDTDENISLSDLYASYRSSISFSCF